MAEEMTPELEAWVRWKMLNPSPDVEPNQHDIFMDGYRAGNTRVDRETVTRQRRSD